MNNLQLHNSCGKSWLSEVVPLTMTKLDMLTTLTILCWIASRSKLILAQQMQKKQRGENTVMVSVICLCLIFTVFPLRFSHRIPDFYNILDREEGKSYLYLSWILLLSGTHERSLDKLAISEDEEILRMGYNEIIYGRDFWWVHLQDVVRYFFPTITLLLMGK